MLLSSAFATSQLEYSITESLGYQDLPCFYPVHLRLLSWNTPLLNLWGIRPQFPLLEDLHLFKFISASSSDVMLSRASGL
jgi:hypothetical protein